MNSLLLAALGFSVWVESAVGGREANDSARLLLAAPLPVAIGLGESAHDDPGSLAWRNELTLALVRRNAARLVLLEIGYAESRLLDAYVKGGGPLTPDTLGQGFTNGLGMFAENRALVEALRSINMGRPLQDRVGIAGIDLSTGGPWGSAPGMAPVDCALEAVPAKRRTAMRVGFAESVKPGLEGTSVTPRQVAAYRRLVTRLRAAVSGAANFEQRVCLRIVEMGAKLMETLPRGLPGAGIPRDAWRNIEARDQAMADNVLLLASRSQGRPVVLLSHLSHIVRTPMRGPRWAQLERSPRSMGYFLAERLGHRYRTIIEAPLPSRSTCPAAAEVQLFMAFGAPDATCSLTVNRTDSQIIDLKRSADLIRFLPRKDQPR